MPKKNPKVKKEDYAQSNLVVQELNVTSINRSPKDIETFKAALSAAESISFPNRALLYDLYDDVLLDGHLYGIINKRIDFVLNKSLHFVSKTKIRVKEMDSLIESDTFEQIIRSVLNAKFWGLTGLEFIPGKKLEFNEIPRKHIRPEKGIIVVDQNDDSGISYKGRSNVWVIGKENDKGLLLKCSLYALYKRGTLGDYAQFIEIFGQPVRIIYYDAYDTKTKSELRKVLDESGSSLAMMIPKQAQFEMLDGKESNAEGDLQLNFLNYCNDMLSVIVLGNTETTRSSKSSGYAQSKEHGAQQREITKSDIKYVQNMLNSHHFIKILKSYGFPVNDGQFKYEKEIDLEYLKERIKIDEQVVSMGLRPDDDYFYETYGISKPENYHELKAKILIEQELLRIQNEGDDEESIALIGRVRDMVEAGLFKTGPNAQTSNKLTYDTLFAMIHKGAKGQPISQSLKEKSDKPAAEPNTYSGQRPIAIIHKVFKGKNNELIKPLMSSKHPLIEESTASGKSLIASIKERFPKFLNNLW